MAADVHGAWLVRALTQYIYVMVSRSCINNNLYSIGNIVMRFLVMCEEQNCINYRV